MYRSPFVPDEVRDRVLLLVSEKTGYPADKLALDLDFETDLGVNAAGRAALFAAIREEFRISRNENVKAGDYPTLRRMIQFVKSRLTPPGTTKPMPLSRPVLVECENEVSAVPERILTPKPEGIVLNPVAESNPLHNESSNPLDFSMLDAVEHYVRDRRERPEVSAGLVFKEKRNPNPTPEPVRAGSLKGLGGK